MIIKNTITESFSHTCVALGFFDGIHLGHQSVINNAVSLSNYKTFTKDNNLNNNLIPTIFTFQQLPDNKSKNTSDILLLTNNERNQLVKQLGIKQVYNVNFNTISHLSPDEFFCKIILNKLKAKKLVCGFNYHFGHTGKASINDLSILCLKHNVDLTVSSAVNFEGHPISSTRIRNEIKSGNITAANKMLGRNFSFTSNVIHGKKLGRTLGTPTINQKIPQNIIKPLFGVYASIVHIDNKVFMGVTNIGIKPTFTSNTPNLETWMPDYNGQELYNKTVKVELIKFIRPEKRFGSMEQLSNAIKKDAIEAKEIFNSMFINNTI